MPQRILVLFFLCAALCLVPGCFKPRHPGPGSAYEEIQREMDLAAESSPVGPPPEVMAALLPSVDVPLPEPEEQRFDISVHEYDARTFFMGLVQGTEENMLVHPGVEGSISLELRNVTIAETMEMVRDVYGYDYRRTAAGWQVFPAALQSRMFVLSNLHLTRKGATETLVSAGGISQNSENNRTTSKGSSSKIVTDSEMDFWKEMETSLQVIVGADAGRKVQVNPHTGLVLVRALPGELREVEMFLRAVQDNVTRQVILEAKILEVILEDGFQSGINWFALGYNKDGNSLMGGMIGESPIADGVNLFDSTGLASAGSTLRAAGELPVFSAALRISDFASFIELLETQGDVHVLSSPRISTLNNQKALIKVGQDEFFVTDVDTEREGTGTDRSILITPTLAPFFSGIALDVTPTIDEGGMVMLHIRPLISEVRQQNKQITLGTESPLNLPMARSTIRESDTVVRARSGQIVVIGGLMQDVQRDEQAGIPGLSRLPLVGGLFSFIDKQRTKTELVILLRPIVVDSDQVWADALDESSDRFRAIYP